MAKNLKLKIKNAQLAEALKINKLKNTADTAKKKQVADKTEKEPKKKATSVKTTRKKVQQPETLPPIGEEEKVAKPSISRKKGKPVVVEKEPISKKPEASAKAEESIEKIAPKAISPPPKKAQPTTDESTASKTLEKEKEKKKGPEFEKGVFKRATPKDFKDVKAAKRTESRPFDARDRQGLRETEEGSWRRRRPKMKTRRTSLHEEIIRPKNLKVKLPITVKDLAQEMKRKSSELVSKLFMQGFALTLNDYLDDETTIQLLGQEFGCDIEIDTTEEKRLRITDKTISEEIADMNPASLNPRPPVIAFMGHVDHGKTSLIDAIRKSDIVSQEAGSITQHIGAFKCHTEKGEVTILDTPGHEAFSEMRERGATVTDIVILVIAGDEGMKPQTEEAMQKALDANVPLIIAINKSDKPGFNPENVYRQLADHNLLPEAWGGSVITVNCSAVTGEGVINLLEMLLLQAEVLELKANPSFRARGSVLESELYKGLGITATLLVQNGCLQKNDAVVIGQIYGRVKTMHDEHAKSMSIASPSTPVKVTGLSGLPEAGSEFIVVESEKEARKLSEERSKGKQRELLMHSTKGELEALLQQEAEKKEKKTLNLIIRADVQGSLEAIKTSLKKLPSDKVTLNVISSGIGDISETDIDLSAISGATILGFHTKIEAHAEPLYKQKKVTVILHNVIYHLIDDVKKTMTQLLDKIREEKQAGVAEVLAIFKSSQLGIIAGCIVQEGTIQRNHLAKLYRNDELIWEGEFASLKRVKEDVKEVGKGIECGILLANYSEVKQGDIIKSYEILYREQTLE